MVHKRSILVATPSHDGVITISVRDIAVLTGRKTMITHSDWLRAVDDGAHMFQRLKPVIHYVDDVELCPNSQQIFNRITCTYCSKNFILISDIRRIFHVGETVVCPICDDRTLAGEQSGGDNIVSMVTVTGTKHLAFVGHFGCNDPASFPPADVVRKWLSRLIGR